MVTLGYLVMSVLLICAYPWVSSDIVLLICDYPWVSSDIVLLIYVYPWVFSDVRVAHLCLPLGI